MKDEDIAALGVATALTCLGYDVHVVHERQSFPPDKFGATSRSSNFLHHHGVVAAAQNLARQMECSGWGKSIKLYAFVSDLKWVDVSVEVSRIN